MDSVASNRFETEIARYNRWREELTQSVHAYHDWLESSGQLDVQQSIRFYDLLENLNKGRLMLAFLAEFSRGKSELINALFFSSFKERLLPSDVGRTTMCPTEIFHDPNEEPYLKLLSVETRYRDESISQLKNMPIEWSKIRLNTGSAADMKKSLKALADTKKVYALEARMLGLAPMVNEKGELPGEEELVEVPAWRYAMINYPHPLLTNGISILDTPGLNALGMEPELTVSTVPNAHAILFLLSIDTGVTKSDMEIWDRYVKVGLPQKIAVLNKIDLMWDELKTEAEIEKAIARMVETTSQHLHLSKDRIFPISAQKGLLGRIRDDAGLVKRSGLEVLEKFLADEVVPMKRTILCKAVVNEIGGMMMSSRALVGKKQQANQAEVTELNGLVGKSREVVQKLWAKITAEKNAYNAALAEYKVNHSQFSAKKAALLDLLNSQKLDATLAKSAQAIEDSWTTLGLQRGMSTLVKDMSGSFEQVFSSSEDIKKLMQGVYNTFIEKFGFQKMTIPALDLDPQRTKLQLLVMQTEQFVKDPVNIVVKEKHFVVKNFYNTLVKEARANFSSAKTQAERWVTAVVLPLEVQIKDHKAQLQSRLDNLAKINEKTTSINEQMAILKSAEADLKKQREMIEGLITRVSQYEKVTDAPPAPAPRAARPAAPADPMQTARMATFEPEKTITQPEPKAPLIADDAFASMMKKPATPAPAPAPAPVQAKSGAAPGQNQSGAGFDPMKTQQLGADPQTTQRIDAPSDQQRTQRLDAQDPQRTTRLDAQPSLAKPASKPATRADGGDKTVQIPKLDPGFKPDATQKMDASPVTTQKLDPSPNTTQKLDPPASTPNAEQTQRLDDSIWKLQEAKRILQNINQK
ncbi:MAG TPA: dynamin family protein [Usitatibacter sp.]|nr:dynamin family protein [Usitatibacter sp.]